MKIAGRVVDSSNKEPLQSASVEVTDLFYAPLGAGAITDAEGKFSLDSAALDNSNNLVIISFVGYETVMLSPQQANGDISLTPSAQERATVYVTAKKRIQQIKVNNNWYYAAVAATLVVAAGAIYYQVK